MSGRQRNSSNSTPMNPQQPVAKKSWWYWLRAAGLLAGMAFMAWLLWQLLRSPDIRKIHFSFWGVGFAVVIGMIGNLVVGITFSDMVAKSAPLIGFRRRISAYYYSQIAKYIPGKVAALLIQRSILAGPRASAATIMSNLELMAATCWLCGGAAIALWVSTITPLGSAIIAIAAVAIGAALIRLNWQPLIRRALSLIPRYGHLATAPPDARRIPWVRASWLSSGILLLPALSSYGLLASGMNIDTALAIPLTSSLLVAWVVGVLAFVFPAGIGVRELIFFGVGNMLVASPGAALLAEVAIASRLLHVVADIVGVALFLVIERVYLQARNHYQP